MDETVTYTTRHEVTSHPPSVAVGLLVVEHGLVGVAEREVQGLCREVTDDVGRVSTPQRNDTLIGGGAAETVGDAVVWAVETANLDHLILYEHAC